MNKKTAILIAVADLTLTALVWWAWGGFQNDIGTLVAFFWLSLSGTIIANNLKK